MNLAIVGSGYVGITVGVGFAIKEHDVTFIDINEITVNKINEGILPLHDETLEDPFRKAYDRGRIDAKDTYQFLQDKEAVFITVPTPCNEDGSINLSNIKKAARKVGKNIDRMKEPLVVVKSTVLPGATEEIVVKEIEKESGWKAGKDFKVCMNPEFLREGQAYPDFMEPDRIVIGEYDKESGDMLEEAYSDFDAPIVRTDIKVAEMIKYTANSLLATKISFANEIGNLCKELGVDTYEVMDAVAMDHRINRKFLDSGVGFGGSCFPKDLDALISFMRKKGQKPKILEKVKEVNRRQRGKNIELAEEKAGKLDGKDVGILGLSFKPGTDDIRESPAIYIIEKLREKNCNIHAHDPRAIENMKKVFPDINYYESFKEVINNSDVIQIITDWPEYNRVIEHVKETDKVFVEGRRVLGCNRKNVEGLCW